MKLIIREFVLHEKENDNNRSETKG